MSHQPERKEKNCLNCGTTVAGRYCHVCGQENIVTKESFWSLTKHFVFDILHFDGKFWHTLKYLIVRPGFVARQYCEGKRSTYLHPIRMYLFTSAIFFLVFFSMNNSNFIKSSSDENLTGEERRELITDYQERLQKDTNNVALKSIILLLSDSTRKLTTGELLALDPKPFFSVKGNRYGNLKEYDSAQNSLPSEERDSWFRKFLIRKAMKFNEKYKGRSNEGARIFWEALLHKLPYMLFLSLPFFALILKLLYARRKNFFYSDHSVFTLYHYIFSFILLLLMIGVGQIRTWTNISDLEWLVLILGFVWMGYLLIELKNFYRQGWIKTFLKFLLLNMLGMFTIFILFLAFLLFSIFEL